MIVVTTPTGQIGRQVLDKVLDGGEPVRVIARDPSRLAPEVRERVEIVKGSHDDIDVVTDRVFWLVPPNPHAESAKDYYLDFTRPEYDADAWLRGLPVMDLFGCLVFQIIGQQLSVKATRAILERLTSKFDGRMPSAKEASELDEQALRDIGFSWRKARTVLDLAARFADGRLSEKRLSALPDDRVIEELTQITGIGPWTVHGALLIALRRADVVPTGDIMLANTMKTYYDLDHVPTEEEISDIAVAWHPYGSLGVNLLFAAAELD